MLQFTEVRGSNPQESLSLLLLPSPLQPPGMSDKKGRRFAPSRLYAHNIARHRDSSNKIVEVQRMWGAHLGNQKLEELIQTREEKKEHKRRRKDRDSGSGSGGEGKGEGRRRSRSPKLKRSASEEAMRRKAFVKTALNKGGPSVVKREAGDEEELVKVEEADNSGDEREKKLEDETKIAPKVEERKVRGRGSSSREQGGARDREGGARDREDGVRDGQGGARDREGGARDNDRDRDRDRDRRYVCVRVCVCVCVCVCMRVRISR
jgi:hypothetical protein